MLIIAIKTAASGELRRTTANRKDATPEMDSAAKKGAETPLRHQDEIMVSCVLF
jgi:hypothetical protein